MKAWKSVKTFFSVRGLKDLSYDELFEEYRSSPADVMAEFENRLTLIVHTMCLERARQEGLNGTDADTRADELTYEAFVAFEPSFGNGDSRFGLARFGTTLRSVVGESVFQKNACVFYTQLPVYTIADARQRTAVSLLMARGMADDAFNWVAHELQMAVEELEAIFANGLKALEQAKRENFAEGELSRLTEGYVQ